MKGANWKFLERITRPVGWAAEQARDAAREVESWPSSMRAPHGLGDTSRRVLDNPDGKTPGGP